MTSQEITKVGAVDAHGDYAVTSVSTDQKKSTLDVSVVSAGFCICMSGLFTGAAIAAGLGLQDAIIATIFGNIILAGYGGLLGSAGAKEGVATAVLARHSFGRQGSMIVGAVLALTMLGWFSVQVGFFGLTINTMFPTGGLLTSVRFAALWGGILMILTAYFGYKGLSILSKIAIPAIVITAVIGIFAAVNQAGGWELLGAIKPAQSMTLGTGIVLAVGSFAGGASAQADITRYAKSPKAAWIATIFGFIVANSFVIIAGLITTLATGSGDLPSSMLALGLGFPALIVLLAGQWTTNDNNLYTSSLGLSNLFKTKKSKIVVIGGSIATLIGVAGLADFFVLWLTLLGIMIPPMAGIIIADYYLLKQGRYKFGPGTKYVGIYWPAIVAWILASIGGYYIKWGVASLNSLVLGLLFYLLIAKLTEKFDIKVSSGISVEDKTGF